MRRYLLVFMMLLLPLQWGWAAAASVCQHETGGAHMGHHEHEHDAADGAGSEPAPEPSKDADGKPLTVHTDCQVCHGLGVGCAPTMAGIGAAWSSDRYERVDGAHLPEPPLETLLRPPLTLVA